MPNGVTPMSDIVLRRTESAESGQKRHAANDPDNMEKACKAFESLFVNYLMKEMRQTVPENTLFGGGSAEQIYTTMLDSEVAKHVSSQRGIGLSDMLMEQMTRYGSKK